MVDVLLSCSFSGGVLSTSSKDSICAPVKGATVDKTLKGRVPLLVWRVKVLINFNFHPPKLLSWHFWGRLSLLKSIHFGVKPPFFMVQTKNVGEQSTGEHPKNSPFNSVVLSGMPSASLISPTKNSFPLPGFLSQFLLCYPNRMWSPAIV